MNDTKLITAFLNEQCHIVELISNPSKETRLQMVDWCEEHVGEEGDKWQMIQIEVDVNVVIFIEQDHRTQFVLTWC